jgi:hypothetical protein
MRLPRFRLGGMMIAVAIAGLACWGSILCYRTYSSLNPIDQIIAKFAAFIILAPMLYPLFRTSPPLFL